MNDLSMLEHQPNDAASPGYYCLVQFRPDPAAMEAINQGVLLFCPEQEFIECRCSKSTRRLERAFGRKSFVPDQVRRAAQVIADRISREKANFKTIEDLRAFVDSRTGNVVLSDPRPIKVTLPDEDINSLFRELVRDLGIGRTNDIRKAVRLAFDRPSLKEKLHRGYSITIKPGVQRTFPFAYRNGTMNCIRPVRFGDKALDMAFRCGGESVEINQADESAKLVIIADFPNPDSADKTRLEITSVLEDFRKQLRVVMAEDIKKFAEEIERTAH